MLIECECVIFVQVCIWFDYHILAGTILHHSITSYLFVFVCCMAVTWSITHGTHSYGQATTAAIINCQHMTTNTKNTISHISHVPDMPHRPWYHMVCLHLCVQLMLACMLLFACCLFVTWLTALFWHFACTVSG